MSARTLEQATRKLTAPTTIRVTSADARGVHFTGYGWCSWGDLRAAASQCSHPHLTHEAARQMDPEGAALEDCYAEFLRQARAICPPSRRIYHDPCDHERGACRPMVMHLDVDEVQVEGESQARQRAIHAEIDALRQEVRS